MWKDTHGLCVKAHIGVDAGSGMAHSVETTAANVSDIETAHKLIREDDEVVNGDAGIEWTLPQ
jgi:IS5 family transposase